MNKKELELKRKENLSKLDIAYRDDRHINCVRFSKGKSESVKHKLAKSIAGILASEGVPIEDMADFFGDYPDTFKAFTKILEGRIRHKKTSDPQDFIQEARFKSTMLEEVEHTVKYAVKYGVVDKKGEVRRVPKKQRRIDHFQIWLGKMLEFETNPKVKKEGAITVRV